MLLRKAIDEFQTVLGDTTDKIIGAYDIERAANPACKNVDVEAAYTRLAPLEYWIVRLRGR